MALITHYNYNKSIFWKNMCFALGKSSHVFQYNISGINVNNLIKKPYYWKIYILTSDIRWDGRSWRICWSLWTKLWRWTRPEGRIVIMEKACTEDVHGAMFLPKMCWLLMVSWNNRREGRSMKGSWWRLLLRSVPEKS